MIEAASMAASAESGGFNDGEPDLFWGRLLPAIYDGQVIPIIGPELLPYHQSLALALADRLRVPRQAAAQGIVGVADAFAAGNINVFRSSGALQLLLGQHTDVPQAIRDLVAIDKFKLIVMTDYASLVERALEEQGNLPRSFALRSPGIDDIDEYPTDARYVYHLLGRFPGPARSRSRAWTSSSTCMRSSPPVRASCYRP